MSVTSAKGFRAAGVSAAIKKTGAKDLAIVVNDGPLQSAAGVFTKNRIKAAPVVWTEDVIRDRKLHAVVLNSGGANACTGPLGVDDTQRTAARASAALDCFARDVAVCSTGIIGERLPMANLLVGIDIAVAKMDGSAAAGATAAEAIITTDSVPKTASVQTGGYTIGGMAKGAGMIAPALATMLVVITTDAHVDGEELDKALRQATHRTFDRIDSDGCMSTNDTVLVLASGASGVKPKPEQFASALQDVCMDLARQLIADAEGATKDVGITVVNALTEDDAVVVAKEVARSNLLKCAIHGEDPNWGRVLSAVGVTNAYFVPDEVSVAINDVWVCRNGGIGEDRTKVDMTNREVNILIDLHAGTEHAQVWTNDLTAMYVHENSAYST